MWVRHSPWIVGPVALVGSLVVWYVADRALGLGLLDRAQATGLIALPLLLASPGASTLGMAEESRRARSTVAIAQGVIVAAMTMIGLLLSITQVGCVPVGSPLDVIPGALGVGLVAGVGYTASTALAMAVAKRQGLIVTFLVGGAALIATGLAALRLLFLVFHVVSCAAP